MFSTVASQEEIETEIVNVNVSNYCRVEIKLK